MTSIKSIAHFHYLTQDGLTGLAHSYLAELACSGGARWIQFRMKSGDRMEVFEEAIKVKQVCQKYNATFIINDHVNLCREIKADGVHLGKGDKSPAEARKILGDKCIIGATANNEEEIAALQKEPIDYIGLGPFNLTDTKENPAPVLGKDIKKLASAYTAVPVIAIGGIKKEDVSGLLNNSKVHGIAVCGAINSTRNIRLATEEFLKAVNSATS